MRKKIISPEQSLTFSDYFKLNLYIEDVADYFGYRHQKESLILPNREIDRKELETLIEPIGKAFAEN